LRVSLHQLDTFSDRWLHGAESLGSPAQHLVRRVGENDVIAALGKPQRLMPRAAADIDDARRGRWQVQVELPGGQLVTH
jgi:hypothetical protein